MEYRRLGRTGLKVSALGFGGVEIGFLKVGEDVVGDLIGGAVSAGLNFLDTAAAYWSSEESLGRAIQGRRKELVLATKCGELDGFTRSDWSKKGILETITDSLQRLRTDYLDIIQLHSCKTDVLERGEAIEALIVAKERGYARFAGYSGDGTDALTAIRTGFFDTLQTSVSIADQEAIELTLPEARERGMGIIAKRPVANAVWRNEERPDYEYHQPYWDRIEELGYDFLKLPLEESMGIALRFTLTVEGVASAIVGTSKPGRWSRNAEYVAQGPLSGEQFEEIRDRWRERAGDDWTGQV